MICHYCHKPVEAPATGTGKFIAHNGCWIDSRNHAYVIFRANGKVDVQHLSTDASAVKFAEEHNATAVLRNFQGQMIMVYPHKELPDAK